MKVYFVRHGESRHNAENIIQSGAVPLSEKGLQQAQMVAERFRNISIDGIIASDYERARQTAELIAESTGKEIIFTDLARERKQATEIEGKSAQDPEVQRVTGLLREQFGNAQYQYSDEENFYALKSRALKLIDYIQGRPEENLLVVLHGTILRCVVAVMMFGDTLTPDDFFRFHFFYLENTGITVCELNNNTWKLMTWNDQAHLG